MWKFLPALIVCLFFTPAAFAQDVPSTPAGTGDDGPTLVHVGTYVQNITDIDFRNNKVTVDFYLWMRWKGDDVNPEANLELVKAEILLNQSLDRRMIGDENFIQARIRAILDIPWDMRFFSLDTQVISIIIEDLQLGVEDLVYVPDTVNSTVRDGIWLPGYVLARQQALVVENLYTSNFGDPQLSPNAESTFSRYVHEIVIKRSSPIYFFKLFITIFLSTLIVCLAFALEPENVDGRVGLGVGSLFAVVATNYVISSQLPETDIITLADRINFASMSMILVSLVLAVLAWRLWLKGGHERLVVALDRIGLIAMPTAYVGYIASMVLSADVPW